MSFIRKKVRISKSILDGISFVGQRLFPQQANYIKIARVFADRIIDNEAKSA